MTFLQKRPFFFTTTQKHWFSVFFLKFSFSIFCHIVLSTFSNIKKTKTKSAHFFVWKPFFWHPDKLQKKYFRTRKHYLWFSRPPKTLSNWGGKQAKKKILDRFRCSLGQIFDASNGKSWTDFRCYSIYIYIERDHPHPNKNEGSFFTYSRSFFPYS